MTGLDAHAHAQCGRLRRGHGRPVPATRTALTPSHGQVHRQSPRPTASPPDRPRNAADECVSRVRMRWIQSRRPWMLALVDKSPSGDGDGPVAVPAVYCGTEGRPGPVLFTLDVDGERFAIRRAGDGGTGYDWLSGPNQGYGFGSSETPNRPVREHREYPRLPRHDRSQYGLHRRRLRGACNPPEPSVTCPNMT